MFEGKRMQSRQLISFFFFFWERLRQLIQGRKPLRRTGLQLYFRLSERDGVTVVFPSE